jgi:hypothetical protein
MKALVQKEGEHMNPIDRDSYRRFIGSLVHPVRRRLLLLAVLVPAAAGLALVPAPALAQDPGFTCTDRSGGKAGEVQAALTSVRFAHHDGYDRVVFGFANAPAVPGYQLTQQASASFTQGGGKGTTRTLSGSAGLFTVFAGTLWTDGVPLTDARPALPVVREVASIENFEGVTSYGIGLSQPACFRTMELSGPSRLVIDFATPIDQPAAGAASTQSTPPQAASPQTLAQTGQAAGHPVSTAGDRRTPAVALVGALLLLFGAALIGARRRWARR